MRDGGDLTSPTSPRQEQIARAGLFVAMAAGTLVTLYVGRGLTYSVDDLVFFAESPGLDLRSALEPHGGHLTLTSRLVYKAVLELFGSNYLAFRLLTVFAVLTTVGLLFVYCRRRIGALAALAPCLVLLVFGSDPLHSLSGNGFTVVGSLACGIAALLVVERGDLAGDLGACVLLCLGVATYTEALPFAVAAGVYLAIRAGRRRRLWVAAIPLALYSAWWLWARDLVGNGSSQTDLSKLLLAPASAYKALSAALGALTGLDYPFGTVAEAGAVLALCALAGLVWHLARGRVPDTTWTVLAVPATLWILISLAKVRSPDDSRYLFAGAVAVVLVAAEAARGVRWSRRALIVLFLVAAVGVCTNLALLRDSGAEQRSGYVPAARAELAALDFAGSKANPGYYRRASDASLFFAFDELHDKGEPAAASYLAAAKRYGALGYSPAELSSQPESARVVADEGLVGTLGLAIQPLHGEPAETRCLPAAARPGLGATVHLPPGGATLESPAGGQVAVRRFADTPIPIGDLAPRVPAVLRLPAGRAGRGWQLASAAAPLKVCPLGP